MSLSRKALLIVAVPVVFEMAFLVLLVDAERRSARFRRTQWRSMQTIISTYRQHSIVLDGESGMRGYIATGNPEFLDRYQRAVREFPAQRQQLDVLDRGETVERIGRNLPNRYKGSDLNNTASALFALLERRQTEGVARLLDQYREQANGYLAEELAMSAQQRDDALKAGHTVRTIAIAFFVTNIVVTLALVMLLARHIRRRLRLILKNMGSLSAGGPLHAPVNAPDEIGRLDAGFHEMAVKLRAAEEQLRLENEELERMNVEKNRFLGMAAHDLRNPLFGVQMMAEVLIRRSCLIGEDLIVLERIAASVRSMTALVNDFLDVSKIEAGELTLRPRETDLAAMTRRSVDEQQPLAAQKGIEIRYHGEPGPVLAVIDPDKIAQVLTNLITNAVKFSPADSAVGVRLAREGSMVRISVANEGQGIEKNEMNLLFQPFARTSSKPTAGETSTGLGLAISRKIIDGHGGKIRAESEPGKGAVFTVEIPLAPG